MGNAMEKKSMNINPTQKAGMEKPARAKKLVATHCPMRPLMAKNKAAARATSAIAVTAGATWWPDTETDLTCPVILMTPLNQVKLAAAAVAADSTRNDQTADFRETWAQRLAALFALASLSGMTPLGIDA